MGNADKYLKRVLPQHKKPNFLKWLEANLDIVSNVDMLFVNMDNEFDLDKAKGAQLNVLGEIIGRPRLLDFQPIDGSDPLLDDEMYRLLLKAKIAINNWDGTIESIYELWDNLFPEYEIYIRDNMDMTMDVFIKGPAPLPFKELVARNYIVPRPMTVGTKYTFLQEFEAEFNLYVADAITASKEYEVSNAQNKTFDVNAELFVGNTIVKATEYMVSNGSEKKITILDTVHRGKLVLSEKYYRI